MYQNYKYLGPKPAFLWFHLNFFHSDKFDESAYFKYGNSFLQNPAKKNSNEVFWSQVSEDFAF